MIKCFKKYSFLAIAFVAVIVAAVAMPTMAFAGDNFYQAKPTFNIGAGAAYQEVLGEEGTQATTSIGAEWVAKKNWLAVDLGLTSVPTGDIEAAYTADVKVGLVIEQFRPYVGLGYKEVDLAGTLSNASIHKASYGFGVRFDVDEDMFVDTGFKYSSSNNKLTTVSTHYRF